MNLWHRIKAAFLDQRGELSFAGDVPSVAGLGQDISQYIPQAPGPMDTSVGKADSFGPYGDAGGGGGGGFNLDTISGYAKAALPLLQLGTQGLGAYTGVKGIMDAGQQKQFLTSAERTGQQIAGPAAASAGQLIPAGTQALMGGALPPELEATAVNWANSAKARIRQYFAHAGISDSQMIAQAEAQIDAQAQELRAQLAQGLLSGGQGVAGVGVQGAQLEGQLAGRQGDTINQALSAANQALFKMMGMTG